MTAIATVVRSTDVLSLFFEDAYTLLSHPEKHKHDSYRRAKDREDYLAAHMLIRALWQANHQPGRGQRALGDCPLVQHCDVCGASDGFTGSQDSLSRTLTSDRTELLKLPGYPAATTVPITTIAPTPTTASGRLGSSPTSGHPGLHGCPSLEGYPGIALSWAHCNGYVAAAISGKPQGIRPKLGIDIESTATDVPIAGMSLSAWTKAECCVKAQLGVLETTMTWDFGAADSTGITSWKNLWFIDLNQIEGVTGSVLAEVPAHSVSLDWIQDRL